MLQHRLDDPVRALAMLGGRFQVTCQCHDDVVHFVPPILVQRGLGRFDRILQFVQQFNGDFREVIDEVQRVLDFMCDAGGELAQ